MKILAIETSCDETAIALVEVSEKLGKTKFKILANEVSSQVAIHAQFGGVFPAMAKREHGKNITHILEKVLNDSKLSKPVVKNFVLPKKTGEKIRKILERENDLAENFINFANRIKTPKIDAITVTTGPGLEPALWVGISFAKALSYHWNIPFVPANHMEGHIFSVFPTDQNTFTIDSNKKIFPVISLLVSGGHTEIILMKDWPASQTSQGGMKYKKVGTTRDDASGEAFDKVARMLGLPYPGGPEISKLAAKERGVFNSSLQPFVLPRPMINSKDYDFSFSGLKTAVLYMIRDLKEKYTEKELEKLFGPDSNWKQKTACEFENSVIEVLVSKTIRAIKEFKARTLIVGGGVSANKYLQETMKKEIEKINEKQKEKTTVHFPSRKLTGDNALMIAIAGYYQFKNKKIIKNLNSVKANGNLSL
jgi:N6-L-threonylcarbamoyladenine synthase